MKEVILSEEGDFKRIASLDKDGNIVGKVITNDRNVEVAVGQEKFVIGKDVQSEQVQVIEKDKISILKEHLIQQVQLQEPGIKKAQAVINLHKDVDEKLMNDTVDKIMGMLGSINKKSRERFLKEKLQAINTLINNWAIKRDAEKNLELINKSLEVARKQLVFIEENCE